MQNFPYSGDKCSPVPGWESNCTRFNWRWIVSSSCGILAQPPLLIFSYAAVAAVGKSTSAMHPSNIFWWVAIFGKWKAVFNFRQAASSYIAWEQRLSARSWQGEKIELSKNRIWRWQGTNRTEAFSSLPLCMCPFLLKSLSFLLQKNAWICSFQFVLYLSHCSAAKSKFPPRIFTVHK